VWSSFTTNLASDDTKPIIMVNAKLDAMALVRDFGVGASSKASIAVLLAVVEALSKVISLLI
jgi:Nicastrin